MKIMDMAISQPSTRIRCVCVTAAGGAIRVEGAEGAEAEVYSLSGALLYRGTDSTIALPRGIYIVKVAGTTTKVIL